MWDMKTLASKGPRGDPIATPSVCSYKALFNWNSCPLVATLRRSKRSDIVITKPNKGSGVVVMDKSEYLRLLSEASINDSNKFRAVPLERPSGKGRSPTYYHPLLQKEKELESIIRRILLKPIADTVRPTGLRLAHLYGLPKTHKDRLAMRPILSATQTYNYALVKWLDTKLKPLPLYRYTVTDIFEFANEIRNLEIANGDILVSYDVSSLFTNVPLDETIQLLANRAFANNWFKTTYDLNLTKTDLVDLLSVATKAQLFQFNGALYEQTDGVAMGSPLGPLLANVFMSHIEENLEQCVVYSFQCDLCDAGYVDYTRRHLHNRVKGHKQQSSAIAKHYKNMHGTMPQGLLKRFKVLKKCRNKFDCLVYEMLFIRALKPNLNVQSDSIRAKVFLESSHPLMLILRAKIALNAVICMILFIFPLIMES